MLSRLYQNPVLVNLTLLLVIVMGYSSYQLMPREQDPSINFNWIQIITFLPSATAEDVELQVTDILENNIRGLSDIRFISSNSRQGVSSLLIRFNDISERQYDKRLADLRRRLQSAERELPEQAVEPKIFEVTTANAFPTATIAVVGATDDEVLRYQASLVKKDLEQIKQVDRVLTTGLNEPEIVIEFDLNQLQKYHLQPLVIQQTVQQYFRNMALGEQIIEQSNWLIRLQGKHASPKKLAELPLVGQEKFIQIKDVARVQRQREKAVRVASFEKQPAIILSVSKKGGSNTLNLVDAIEGYVKQRNKLSQSYGIRVLLIDDQTQITKNALYVMQTNALLGLILVLFVTWLFLGTKIAFFTTIGIPFVLAGTFWVLAVMGQTLNVVVLMGIVISLGMLVDDAVVVVESIYYRLQRGMHKTQAITEAIEDVFAPVTASVLTTIAAFLPLMLLPGIMGKFMFVVPMVVTLALLISLIEAYWILPAHIQASKFEHQEIGQIQQWRINALQSIRLVYARILARVMRYPKLTLSIPIVLFCLAILILSADNLKDPFNVQYEKQLALDLSRQKPMLEALAEAKQQTEQLNALYPAKLFQWIAKNGIDVNFFANDPIRLFYLNLEMPAGTPLRDTLSTLQQLEQVLQANIQAGEVRNKVSYAGLMLTETEPFYGNHYGQILFSLMPSQAGLRTVDQMIAEFRPMALNHLSSGKLSFLRLAGGPPATRPISIKVRGDNLDEFRICQDYQD